jgi:hypothetical protein
MKLIESGNGKCDLSGKDGEGVTVEYEDGGRAFLSWKALKQQVEFETRKHKGNGKEPPRGLAESP